MHLRSLLPVALFLLPMFAAAQGVGINNPTPDASALLDLTSTNKGLLLPRMTTVQRNAIPVPATSLVIFNTTTSAFEYFDGAAWVPFVQDGWSLTGDAGTNPTTNFIGTLDAQPLVFRQNGIERMRIANGVFALVGINTTTPGAPLHVRNTALLPTINPTLQLEASIATSSTNITFRNTSNPNVVSLGLAGNGDFGLARSANFSSTIGDVFRIKPNGNVGLGTTNALDRLHVVGNIRMVDGNQAAGRVLVSDANGTGTWTAANTLSSGTLDQAYDFGGGGAGRTITADAGAVTIGGTDGLLSMGSLGLGAVAPSGAGVRMFWNPRHAAFRAGSVSGAEWDPVNLGFRSVAFGNSSTASGQVSTAFGSITVASGLASTAMGELTTASGTASFAVGQSNTASGIFSMALGRVNTASGYASTTLGASNVANGERSLAAGTNNTAPSYGETVIGIGATTYTPSSATAFGSAQSTDRLFTIGNAIDANSNGVVDFAERSTALVVLKNGNTGIGSSTPATRLHVVGSIRMVDGNQAVGRVLVSDANGTGTWTVANTLSSGTLDQAYDFGGAGAGRTITADAGAVTIEGTDGLVCTGTLNSGVTAPTGPGTKLFWNPRKSAFRVGTLDAPSATVWDDTNIGQYSVAFGRNTVAQGSNATAFGSATSAFGDRATAFGNETNALTQFATAFGSRTTASAVGSTAMGLSTTASGVRSTAMGENHTAASYGETVIGIGATNYTPSSAFTFRPAQASDRLFVVGNAIDANSNSVIDAAERSNALTILKNGNTGLGTATPAFRLQLSSNSAAKPGSTVWTVPSDARLKRDVMPFTEGIELLQLIDPVWYTYTGEAGMPQERFVGTLAQELQKIAPFMVKPWTWRDDQSGRSEEYLSIDYGALDFVMINALKEQQTMIDELRDELSTLRSELEELRRAR